MIGNRRSGRRWLTGALLVAVALLVGCASASPGANPSTSAAGSGEAESAGAVTLSTADGALGAHLVDGGGRTLYLFDQDTGTPSCYADCAASWPPLLAPGGVTAGGGVDQDKLATATRTDGAQQVVYAGHPLYRYAGDSSAGQTAGQGVDGAWWVVGTDGEPIKSGDEPPAGMPDSGY